MPRRYNRATNVKQDSDIFLSQFGESITQEIVMLAPMPVLLLGGTGWGKSVLAREVSRRLQQEYLSINAYPGMDIGLLVGMWRPTSDSNGISVVWEDGSLTRAVKQGAIFLLEEITRAPQEMVSRLFGLLDTSFRYWSIPEAGIPDVPVHPKFAMVATANPSGLGYASQKLDKAMQRRFAAIFEIDAPIADEMKILESRLPTQMVSRVYNFMQDARKDAATNLNTGDIVHLANLIHRGFSPIRAVSLAIVPKYPDSGPGLKLVAKAHFI